LNQEFLLVVDLEDRFQRLPVGKRAVDLDGTRGLPEFRDQRFVAFELPGQLFGFRGILGYDPFVRFSV